MNDVIVNIIKQEPFVGKDGLDYIKVTKVIQTPRKTFLKGTITGKYRGDKIPGESDMSELYDFEIYEAEVTCQSIEDFSKNKPFVFPKDFKNIDNPKIKGKVFPKSKLPTTLSVIINANNKTFGINVLEPKLFEFSIIRKLHQIEGDEIFGSFNAYITGYVFDEEREEVEEIIGPILEDMEVIKPIEPIIVTPCKCSTIETGETQAKGDYIRKEYKCKNHNDNIWGNWEYSKKESFGCAGCFSQIFVIVAALIGLFFLIQLWPFLLIYVGIYLVLFLIGFVGPFFKWIFRILGILFFIAFMSAMVKTCSTTSRHYVPTPRIVDSPREKNPPVIIPNNDNTSFPEETEESIRDSIITRFRSWKDYSGNKYEGKYQIKVSDYKKSNYYKNNLKLPQNTINSYDRVVYSLKEFDKNNFNSLHKLFDSIGKANQLNKIKFAEMIVSFAQDIPYAIVLDGECDASLYNDRFTRNYLLNDSGECDGGQQFGINTPVEFLANLIGDCDTRTLLLYTILAHYNYDVAMLSSEFYGHSIIGINLPINGVAYTYKNQRYVLWETTAPNIKPGIIPNEISNLNNWRISLKSK